MIHFHSLVAALTLAGLPFASPVAEDLPDGVTAVTQGPFTVTVDLPGVFEEADPALLVFRPQIPMGPAVVLEAAVPGPVTRGQVLIRLGHDALEERIRGAEQDLVTARLRQQRRREEARRADRAAEFQLWTAEQGLARVELADHIKTAIDMPLQVRIAEDRIQDAEQAMADREEEYRIRRETYEADGVLETRERMDIESQRRSLDRSKQTFPHQFVRHAIFMDVTVPRELQDSAFQVRKTRHSLDLLRATSPLRVAQAQHDLERNELALRRQEETLDRLRADREALTVRAPVDGVAIAGRYDGRWSDLGDGARGLRRGSQVNLGQVLYTVVQPAPKQVRTSLDEHLRFQVAEGHSVELVPTAVPDVTLPAVITRIAPYAADGKHEVLLEAQVRHARLFPGSTCQVRLTVQDHPQALTVPEDAVRWVAGVAHVDVWKDGGTTRRAVRAGLTSQGRTEILSGVEAGEAVWATARS